MQTVIPSIVMDPQLRNNAPARGWGQHGSGQHVTIHTTDGTPVPVRVEVAELIERLFVETEKRFGYVATYGTWGYADRLIRGSDDTWSNHSWGTAVDINAPRNPMLHGQPGWQWLHDHGRTDMPEGMPKLWNSYGFWWGGDYPSRQDAMHYEFGGTPADAAALTAHLRAAQAGEEEFTMDQEAKEAFAALNLRLDEIQGTTRTLDERTKQIKAAIGGTIEKGKFVGKTVLGRLSDLAGRG